MPLSATHSPGSATGPFPYKTLNQIREDLKQAQRQGSADDCLSTIRSILSGLDATTVEKLLAGASEPTNHNGKLLESELIRRWTHLDLQSALDFAGRTVSSRVDKSLLYDAMSEWARKEPEAALEFLHDLNDQQPNGTIVGNSYRDRVVRSALKTMAEKGADRPFVWAQDQLKEGKNKELTGEILSALAATDIPRTIALYSSLPKGMATRARATREIMWAWAQTDIPAARQWMESLTDLNERTEAIRSLMFFWPRKDTTAAIEYAANLTGQFKDAAMWSLKDSGSFHLSDNECQKLINKLPDGKARKMVKEFYYAKSVHSDPAKFRALMLTLDAKEIPKDLLRNMAMNVEPEDRREVLEWARKLPGADNQNTVLRGVIDLWAQDDPKAAALYAAQHENAKGDVFSYALQSVGRQLADGNPKEALDFSKSLPEGKAKDWIVRGVLEKWVMQSPQDAAVYILGASEPEKEKFMNGAIQRWSQSDIASAARCVGQFPESKAKSQGIGHLAAQWAQQDSSKAEVWLQSLPHTASRDAAVEMYAKYALEDEPQTVARLASSISDEGKRNEVMKKVATTWLQTDSTSARVWINSSTLSQETKVELLQSK